MLFRLTSAEQKQVVAGIMASIPGVPDAFYASATQELLSTVLEGCALAGLNCYSALSIAGHCSYDGVQELYKKLQVIAGEDSDIPRRLKLLTQMPRDYRNRIATGLEAAIQKSEPFLSELRRERQSILTQSELGPVTFGLPRI